MVKMWIVLSFSLSHDKEDNQILTNLFSFSFILLDFHSIFSQANCKREFTDEIYSEISSPTDNATDSGTTKTVADIYVSKSFKFSILQVQEEENLLPIFYVQK